MRAATAVFILLLSACATPKPVSTEPVAVIDADPNNLQIEIGRYSALLGQVVEHTGVAYDHVVVDQASEGAMTLMFQLEEAAADYNEVRKALCASRTGATTYVAVRSASCAAGFHPRWDRRRVTYETVARRSNEAGGPIIGLWSEVCDEARRLQPADQKDEPVCPME